MQLLKGANDITESMCGMFGLTYFTVKDNRFYFFFFCEKLSIIKDGLSLQYLEILCVFFFFVYGLQISVQRYCALFGFIFAYDYKIEIKPLKYLFRKHIICVSSISFKRNWVWIKSKPWKRQLKLLSGNNTPIWHTCICTSGVLASTWAVTPQLWLKQGHP